MEFGVFDHLDRYGGPLADYYEDRLKIAEAYDRAGFYAYHLAEHHSTPLGMAPSPSVFLSAVAQRTSDLRFGPLVWAMPLHHPLRLIEEICMLDQLSGGRLEIGFGRGSVPIELEYYGANPDDAQEVYAEAVELVLRGIDAARCSISRASDFPSTTCRWKSSRCRNRIHRSGTACTCRTAPNARRGATSTSSVSTRRRKPVCRSIAIARSGRRSTGTRRLSPSSASAASSSSRRPTPRRMALARRAYLLWHASFTHLFRRHERAQSHPRPATFDLVVERGQGVAGSPATVAKFLSSQLDETGCNYMVGPVRLRRF